MFTGLVQSIGVIKAIARQEGVMRVDIETQINLDAVQIGASICCSGCCLTVVDKSENTFAADVSIETQNKTIFGSACPMTRINIEPSLKLGDELGGHLVSGHVDGMARIVAIEQQGDAYVMRFDMPEDLSKYIARKGSVAVDGISLTVNGVEGNVFDVTVIPHTWAHTTLSDRKIGDLVNIEVDMIARYVERMMQGRI